MASWRHVIPALAVLVGWAGCAPVDPGRTPAQNPPPNEVVTTEWEGAPWGEYTSKRFDLVLRLPDARGWTVSDERSPWLEAKHAGTASSLLVRVWREDEVVGRARC